MAKTSISFSSYVYPGETLEYRKLSMKSAKAKMATCFINNISLTIYIKWVTDFIKLAWVKEIELKTYSSAVVLSSTL